MLPPAIQTTAITVDSAAPATDGAVTALKPSGDGGGFPQSLDAIGAAVAAGTRLPPAGKVLPLPADTALAPPEIVSPGLISPPAADIRLRGPDDVGDPAADLPVVVSTDESPAAAGLVALELMLPPAPRDAALAATPATGSPDGATAVLPTLVAAVEPGPARAAAAQRATAAPAGEGPLPARVRVPLDAIPLPVPVVTDSPAAVESTAGPVQIRDAAGRSDFALADVLKLAARREAVAAATAPAQQIDSVGAAGRALPAAEPSPLMQTGLPTLAVPATAATPGPALSAAPAPSLPALAVPLNDAGWGDALAERVLVMAGQRVQTADIRLNPAELGPLRVEIRVEDGTAQVNFQAQHAVTRDAIEQALPRLRELFAGEGLTLAGTHVGEQGLRDDGGDRTGQAGDATAGDAPDAGDEPASAAAAQGERLREGLVDTFA